MMLGRAEQGLSRPVRLRRFILGRKRSWGMATSCLMGNHDLYNMEMGWDKTFQNY
jgi:hypothetical protein